MDIWQQVDKQLDGLKAEYSLYVKENPQLKRDNANLKDKVLEYNRQIVESEEKLENTRAECDRINLELERTKHEHKTKVETELTALAEKELSVTVELDTRKYLLDENDKQIKQRELDVDNKKNLNDAQSVALDELAKQLQLQADEIKDATKVLNTKSIDNQHELNMIRQRGAELDAQEARNAKNDQDLDERTKAIQATEKRSRANVAQSEELLSTNQLRGIELDKREQFLNNTKIDLEKRESSLKKRTDLFIDGLRQGKVI